MKKFLLGILLSTAFLAGCSGKSNVFKVDVATIRNQSISRNCVLSGTVAYDSEPDIIKTAFTECSVDSVFVRVGDYVKKGDPICSLDISSARREAEELRNKIKNSNEKLSNEQVQGQAAIDHAKKTMDAELAHITSDIEKNNRKLEDYRDKCAQAENAYSALNDESAKFKELFYNADSSDDVEIYGQQYSEIVAKADAKNMEINTYKEKIAELEGLIKESEYSYSKAKADGELSIAQAEYDFSQLSSESAGEDMLRLEELEGILSDNTVKSPSEGYISELFVDEGMILSDGRIGSISDTSRLCIKLTVPDEYVLSISNGTKVKFSSSSMNNIEYTGEIRKVSSYRGEDGFNAEVSIDNADELIAGMTASIVAELDEKTVSVISSDALHKDSEGVSYVFVAEKDGELYKLSKTPVSVGINNINYVEIRSDSISPDTYIVVSDEDYTDGQIVSVEPEEMKNDNN